MLKEALLYLIFFISGFCGLCYEIIWGRELNLILGHTTYAISMTLTAFMSGLAIGSYFFGRFADRAVSHFSLYAYLELGIGFYGLFFLKFIEIYKSFYIFATAYISNFAVEMFVKFALSFALIIIPTTLMGATFPAMSKIIIRNMETRGRSAGLIYFINSVGGAIGCIACGFYMLYAFGTEFSINIACALNILCGVAVLAVRGYFAEEETREAPRLAPGPVLESAGASAIFALFMFSGFISMLFEVTWTRFLILILGSSTYSFSMMLFTFIFFLSIGSLAVSRYVDRISRPVLAFGACEAAIGAYVMLTIPLYERLPVWFVSLGAIGATYFLYQLLNFAVCLFVMAVPAFLFGASFPIAVRAAEMNLSDSAGTIGKLYSYNTAGCIMGSFLTGMAILPRVGFKNTLESGIIIAMIIALAASFAGGAAGKKIKIFRGVCALLIAAVFFLPAWDYRILNIGSFYRMKGMDEKTLRELSSHDDVLYYKENVSATVCVVRDPRDGLIYLKINGKTDGSTSRHDMLTQDFTAIWPMARAKKLKNVLIIGMGTGTTLAAACRFTEPEKITCVEIIPEVIDAAKCFKESYDVYSRDPRVSIVVNDARSFLLTSREKYDVIISEPSNPWIAGIGSLFTTDFFGLCREKLSEGGCMLAWIQAYESSEPVFKLALRTYLDVFPDASLLFNTGYDVYAMGGVPATVADIGECFKKLKAMPGVYSMLEKHGITDEMTLSTMFFMSNGQLAAYVGDGIRNSDNFQVIEFEAPALLYRGARVPLNYRAYAENMASAMAAYASGADGGKKMINAARFLGAGFPAHEIPVSLINAAAASGSATPDDLYFKAGICAGGKNYHEALACLDSALAADPGNVRYMRLRASVLASSALSGIPSAATDKLKAAVSDYKKMLEKDPSDVEAWCGLSVIYRQTHDLGDMKASILKAYECAAARPSVDRAGMLLRAADSLVELEKFDDAVDLYRAALEGAVADAAWYISGKIDECLYLKQRLEKIKK